MAPALRIVSRDDINRQCATTMSARSASSSRPRNRLYRPRLISLVNERLNLGVVCLFSPDGFGKTSLLSDLFIEHRSSACWIQVNPRNSSSSRFIESLIASIRQIFPSACSATLAALQSVESLALEQLMNSITHELEDQNLDDIVLIIDDFHLLMNNSEIDLILNFLTNRIIDRCTVIISGNDDIFSLSSLFDYISNDCVIDLNDMKFTSEEITVYLNHRLKSLIDEYDADELLISTKGSPALIALYCDYAILASSLSIADSCKRALDSPEELFGLMIDNLPVGDRSFVLYACLLPELNSELCDFVFKFTDSKDRFLRLCDVFSLIESNPDSVCEFHCHPVLRTYLDYYMEHRTSAILTQEFLEDLDDRLIQWYSSSSSLIESAFVFSDFSNWNCIVKFYSRNLKEIYKHGRCVDVVDLLSNISSEVISGCPQILVCLGGAYERLGKLDQSVAVFEQVISRAEVLGDRELKSDGHIGCATVLCCVGQFSDAFRHALEGLECARTAIQRSRALRLLARCKIATGCMGDAEHALKEALDVLAGEETKDARAYTQLDWSAFLQLNGKLNEALDCLNNIVEYFESHSNDSALALAFNNYGSVLQGQGRQQQAEDYFLSSIRCAQESGDIRFYALALLGLADTKTSRFELDAADSLYHRGIEIAKRVGFRDLELYGTAMRAEGRRLAGDHSQAVALSIEARGLVRNTTPMFEEAIVLFVEGTCLMSNGELDLSSRKLEQSYQKLCTLGSHREAARAALYRFLAANGDRKSELLWLNRASRKMSQHGYPFVFDHDLGIIAEIQTMKIRDIDLDHSICEQPLTSSFSFMPESTFFVGQPQSALVVLALGDPCIQTVDSECSISIWQADVAREVFYYLIDRPNGFTADEIIDAFWSRSTRTRAISCLHTTLSRIRKFVGSDILMFESDRYMIRRCELLVYDIDAVRNLVSETSFSPNQEQSVWKMELALNFFKGEYLQGLMRDWILERRWEYERLHKQILESIARSHLRMKNFDYAISYFRKLIQFDELDETFYRSLMQAYAMTGNKAKAIECFKSLERILIERLDITPDARTVALAQAILRNDPHR